MTDLNRLRELSGLPPLSKEQVALFEARKKKKEADEADDDDAPKKGKAEDPAIQAIIDKASKRK